MLFPVSGDQFVNVQLCFKRRGPYYCVMVKSPFGMLFDFTMKGHRPGAVHGCVGSRWFWYCFSDRCSLALRFVKHFVYNIAHYNAATQRGYWRKGSMLSVGRYHGDKTSSPPLISFLELVHVFYKSNLSRNTHTLNTIIQVLIRTKS